MTTRETKQGKTHDSRERVDTHNRCSTQGKKRMQEILMKNDILCWKHQWMVKIQTNGHSFLM